MLKNIKNLSKIVIFLIGLFLILMVTPKVLGISTAKGIKNEPEKTIDYFVIGDSLAYRSISPMQVYEEQGYTGYNLGKSGQYFQNGYYALTEALSKQTPKIVLVETNFIFRERNVKSGIEQAVGILTQDKLPIFETHNQWKKLLQNKLNETEPEKKVSNDSMKGFNISKKIDAYTAGDYWDKTDKKKEIPVLTRFYLDELVKLSQKDGFKLIFYSAPSPKNWTYAVHNSIEEFTKANNLDYLDFNLMTKELGVDWSKDTYDKGDHLNFSGAVKFTHQMSGYLNKEGRLVDHRNEEAYNNWGKLLTDYHEKIEKN